VAGPRIERQGASIRLRVRVKPRASKSRVLGWKGDELEVAVAAPPVDGEANAELIRTLASHFALTKSDIEIISGKSGRSKLVRFCVTPPSLATDPQSDV
jgi:uncharacterized protein (TIGR00251 family)